MKVEGGDSVGVYRGPGCDIGSRLAHLRPEPRGGDDNDLGGGGGGSGGILKYPCSPGILPSPSRAGQPEL